MDERLRKLAREARAGDQESLLKLFHYLKKQYCVPHYKIIDTNIRTGFQGRWISLSQICVVPVFGYSYQVLLSPTSKFAYVDVPFQVQPEMEYLYVNEQPCDGCINYWSPASIRMGTSSWINGNDLQPDFYHQIELIELIHDNIQPYLLALFATPLMTSNEYAATLLLHINNVVSPHTSIPTREESLRNIFTMTGL